MPIDKNSEAYKKRQRYWKLYYEIHREEKRAYDKARYKPHPKPKVVRTPEEQAEFEAKRKERARQYYLDHKEYYKEKAHEHYEKYKDDEAYKERKRRAMRKYYYKNRRNTNG
jgi:hypothetical protein